MAPAGNKRKRPDRQDDGSNRASPHRPESLGLAQQNSSDSPARHSKTNRRSSKQDHQNHGHPTNGATNQNASSGNAQQQRDTPAVEPSQSSTPAPYTDPFSAPKEQNGTQSPAAPYMYEFVVDAVVDVWSERREGIISATQEIDEVSAAVILQEIIRSALDGRLSAEDAGSVVKDIIAAKQDYQSLFLSTLSMLDEADTKNPKLLQLLVATNIDPEVVRQELDVQLLQTLSLVRSTFERMRTRKTTNLLYRQANFNLLREESEGYAKLVTEYFNTASEAVHADVSAEDAFQRVMALVGSFDLDVGRVLDITLDISANLLVRASGFFVKFYRCSSWWPENGVLDGVRWEDQGFNSFPDWALPGHDPNMPEDVKAQKTQHLAQLKLARDVNFWALVKEVGLNAFFDIGSRKIVDFENVLPLLETELPLEFDAKNNEVNADRRKRISENRKFMRETGTLPPQGNSDAAQLLGFKLRFYASSARDASDILPENLVYLAALLIKIGFISLRDLYPHLYPSDDLMAEEKTRLEKEKREKDAKARPGAASNALAMAGALPDDTLPAARSVQKKGPSGGNTPSKGEKKDEAAKNEQLPTPTNQKLILLKALLLIGALPEALYILGRFPWIADVDPSIPPCLLRIAKQMLSKVAEAVKPAANHNDLQQSQDELTDTVPADNSSLRFEPRQPKRSTRWLGIDQVERADGQSYRHYYSDWEENIPICQSVEDVFLLCNTFLGFLGVKIGQDAELLETLIRVAKSDLTNDGSDSNRSRWLELMKRLLVPALSLSKHNPGLTQSVYELLMFFDTATRYSVYAEWNLGRTSRLPDMRVAFDHNKAEVKDVLRRVSNETGRKQARALAKVAFSSPGIVAMSMINQLESYSNMIPSLVECTRYFSLLAWDVLNWCLLNSLGGQTRDRIQADGMLTSSWLQALSQFVATLFLRYSIINPSPVLKYLAFELRGGNSTDLEMFEQILAEMAGIKSDMEFNDAQVLAMAGGEHLQGQIVLQLADKRHLRKSSAVRLIKALSDSGLIGQILISIAQERQMYPDREATKYMPLKVLGNNLDKIQQVFAQYLDVLKTSMTGNSFEEAVPNIISLVQDFGLAPGIAFTICRAAIVGHINEYDAAKKLEVDEKKRRISSEKAIPASDLQQVEVNPQSTNDSLENALATAVDGDMEVETAGPSDAVTTKSSVPAQAVTDPQPWHPVLEPIIQQLPEAAPGLADRVSPPFFVTFWTLTLQDILVHTPSYDKEINKLRDQIKQINADRADANSLAAKEKERKKKAATEIQDNLREELKSRIASYQKTRNRLSRREKDHWFARGMEKEEIDARHLGLLQECFLPRATLSSLDAHYCFLMLKILHDNGTPGFSIMHLLNQLLRKQELAAIMFQCTAMEAQHFGRFLCETLKLLQNWHSDKAVYEKEALGGKTKLPGFAKKLDANGDPEVVIGFEEFRRLLFNWHSFLNGALQMCFESGEYMHIRNGIIVLRSVVQVFPTLNFMGHNMTKQVTRLSTEDTRQDLKLAAMSLLGPLRNREKQWMMPQAFRLNDTTKEGNKSGRSNSARPETPQATAETSKLNAAAEEFKPADASLSNGTAKKEAAGPEDGEIDEVPVVEKNGDTEMKDAPAVKAEAKPEEKTEQKEVVGPKKPPAKKEGSTAPAAAPSPAPLPAPVTSRTNSPRPPPNQSSGPRPSHSLPSRPEYGPPKKLPPPSSAHDRGYPSRPDDRYGRLDRPSEVRPSSRDHSPSGRGYGRTPDRDPYGRMPPRDDRMGMRDDRGPPRPYDRDDYRRSAPQPNHRDRPNGSMGPPTPSQGPHHDREPRPAASGPSTPSAENAPGNAASSASTQHNENPARMALINDDRPPARGSASAASQADARRDREAQDDRASHRPGTRTSGRNAPPESPREQTQQDQQGDLAPTGPRHGRLSRDATSSQRQDSNYGRLNSTQDSPSIPSAPNGPGGRGGRNFGGANESPIGPPSRPGADRRASASSSMPATPTTSETAPAVHPSRMGQVSASSAGADSGNGTRQPPAAPMAAPAGPRGPSRINTTGPAADSTPSGPSTPVEKQRRGDRQRASINATLQNSGPPPNAPNAPSVNFRGAAAAQNNRGSAAAPAAPSPSAQSTPTVASSIDPPQRRSEPGLTPQSGRHGDSRHDLFQGSRPNRSEDDRYSRSSHGGSRNASRERGPSGGGAGGSARDDPRDRGGSSNGPPPPEWGGPRGHDDRMRGGPGPRSRGPPPPPSSGGPPLSRRDDDRGSGPRGYHSHHSHPPPYHSSRPDDGYPPSGPGQHGGPSYGGSRKRRIDDGGPGPGSGGSASGGSGYDDAKRRRGGGGPGGR